MNPDTNTEPTVTGPQFGGQPPQQMSPTPAPSSNKKMLAIIGVVVVVIALAVAGYFLFMRDKDDSNTKNAADKSSNQSKETKLDTLEGTITLKAPASLEGYEASSANTAENSVYAKGDCSLQFGVTDASKLPGNDLADIVDSQTAALREQGITMEQPQSGTALVLKDADDSSKSYVLPTLDLRASANNEHVLSHYSAAVFKDGRRAFVTRVCKGSGAAVEASKLAPLDADAAGITVKVQ